MGKGNSPVPDDPTKIPDHALNNELNELWRVERDRILLLQGRMEHARHLISLLGQLQVDGVFKSGFLMKKAEPILKDGQRKYDFGVAAFTAFMWHVTPQNPKEQATFFRDDTVLEATNKLKAWLREQEEEVRDIEFISPKAKPIRP